jgi:hypothetical protein
MWLAALAFLYGRLLYNEAMTELIWEGKYKDGKKRTPIKIPLPFQTIETANETAQERQRSLELFAEGRESEWRNRLIWGDKKYVLPSARVPLLGVTFFSDRMRSLQS